MRSLKKTGIMITILSMVALLAMGCSDDDNNPVRSSTPAPTLDIVETAVAAGDFNTLVAAVQAAGLVDALKGDGPFTVFAPNDDAFSALPEGTIEALLADKETLTSILTYHVVPGAVKAEQVVTIDAAETLNGQSVTITLTSDGKVMIDNATVLVTDIVCSNGIIHVIDAVILPRADASAGNFKSGDLTTFASANSAAVMVGSDTPRKGIPIYALAQKAGLKTLAKAIQAAKLQQTLTIDGPFTVFAPTDDAFAALPTGALESLLQDPEALTNVLLYHVVAGVVKAADVVTLDEATMLNGGTVDITVNGSSVMANDANVIATDIMAKNGVVHLIDAVLLP